MSEQDHDRPRSREVVPVEPTSRGERVAARVGRWSPEVVAAAGVGWLGEALVHPVAWPIAAGLLVARVVWVHAARRLTARAGVRPAEGTDDVDRRDDDAARTEGAA